MSIAVRYARLGALITTTLAGVHLAALRGAGINGTAPPSAAAFKKLISTLTDNAKWAIMTGVSLILVLVVALLMLGSQRAPDHIGRVMGAIAALLVVIPAVLA